jgi:hypothetical protein
MDTDGAAYTALAREIARMPHVAERLRAAHVEGPDERCVGCPSALTVAPRWPCRLWLLADRAVEMARGQANAVVPADATPTGVPVRRDPCRSGGFRRR